MHHSSVGKYTDITQLRQAVAHKTFYRFKSCYALGQPHIFTCIFLRDLITSLKLASLSMARITKIRERLIHFESGSSSWGSHHISRSCLRTSIIFWSVLLSLDGDARKGSPSGMKALHSSYWSQRRDRNCTQIFDTTLKYL